ncbi:MAG: tRNA preQ1(34) S-adenosylmethionine ribosyltransferase-isomerase QueA [Candidatus Tectomicrobia bacterium]|uniref:S-adenosylmethionine:tRNA ribosyltransferase-isomerase n=1 Tax=Tectimicrobiota bacterium TaxID=2528274 RepID=A0A932CKW6_UNCTE|nr:tRNA preQ1(34) S-adenosylmethionine ribosyltransferase-isomerase QueA [Candidatus Tectomicrobia bacterium]
MDLEALDYTLPIELIAQHPAPQREQSRLLVLNRRDGSLSHEGFGRLPEYLREGDLLVLNDTRVFPARLIGRKISGSARVELLLLRETSAGCWEALVRPGKRAPVVVEIAFGQGDLIGRIIEEGERGRKQVAFSATGGEVKEKLACYGQIPLPPYIKRDSGAGTADAERYQTVYARNVGAVAAPTAGLHFTPQLLEQVRQKGVEVHFLTLHVGPGTFQPLCSSRVEDHRMEAEYYCLEAPVREAVARAKREGRRVIAVGTTATRALESAVCQGGFPEVAGHPLCRPHSFKDEPEEHRFPSPSLASRKEAGGIGPLSGWTDLFIYPGYRFQVVEGLLTNFHLPRSTLLALVCAFAGREFILQAYEEAVRQRYRFYSYGDAMLVV